MFTAYVVINTEPEKMEEVVKAIQKIEGVKEAKMVYGIYDIVVTIETDTMNKLKEFVVGNIRRLEGVRSTLTMIAIEGS